MDVADHILLTGAGFTHNFGAPLGAEVWGLIVGHPAIKRRQQVRELLLGDFDFESVYHAVMTGPFNSEDKDAMKTAVVAAFEFVDETVCSYHGRSDGPFPVNSHKINEFIAKFAGCITRPGCLFTLNQDLFVERQYANGPIPLMPGIGPARMQDPRLGNVHRDKITIPKTPESCEAAAKGTDFVYIKLHGSSNWYSSDGSQQMVVGQGKAEQISREPLLVEYSAFFTRALSAGRKRLLVCGYSFRDEHINEAIASAVRTHGLEVFVLSPVDPLAFRDALQKGPHGSTIWAGLYGYFRYTLLELFPANQDVTPAWRFVCNSYWDGHP